MTDGHKPTEGKSETKRHILTNKEEIPISVAVITTANTNTHDVTAAIDTVDKMGIKRASQSTAKYRNKKNTETRRREGINKSMSLYSISFQRSRTGNH
jgi:hypothetical protein